METIRSKSTGDLQSEGRGGQGEAEDRGGGGEGVRVEVELQGDEKVPRITIFCSAVT